MVAQTLKSGFRQIWRRPLLPILNILGLAAGVAVAVVIFLYADAELNFDSWVTEQDTLYRVEGRFVQSANGGYNTVTVTPLSPVINQEIDEVEHSVRIWEPYRTVKRDQLVNYETLTFTESGFFTMFPLTFIEGGSADFFETENHVMISRSMAQKYFGATNIIGETIELNSGRVYSVYGVFEDIPDDSDFTFDFIAKFTDSLARNATSWNNQFLQTYVRLKDGARVSDVNEKLAVIIDQHRPFTGDSPGDMRDIYQVFLQPFGDIHLGSRGRTSEGSIGNYATVYGFVAIALLILTISIFNYVSLATTRAVEREKEFCLRKVSGATAPQIIRQVMVEMVAQTIPAVLVGVLIATDLLPFFSDYIGVDYSLDRLLTPFGITVVVLATLLVSAVAGLYPSVVISRFRPVRFLSGGRSVRPGVARMRLVLVFLQFTVAIALIIGAVAINRQMQHIGKIDLGFDADNLAILRGVITRSDLVRANSFTDQVKRTPGVVSASRASVVPFDRSFNYESFISEHVTRENSVGIRMIATGFSYFDTLGARLIGGRALSDTFANDKFDMFSTDGMRASGGNGNAVINEYAMQRLGYARPADIIGKQIEMEISPQETGAINIVGVVANMVYESARSEMEPRIYTYFEPRMASLAVRLDPAMRAEAVAALEAAWREMYPDTPFRIQDMNERIDVAYASERQQLKLFVTFSVLAIILSLIGLIGLVLNSIMHRTREISMRRVLGATLGDNIKLFTWQYLKPVLIANVPAWAIAYYFLSGWLEKYPDRISIGLDLYLLGSGAIILVTLTLVGLIVTKVADMPPALALKYE